MSAWLFIAEKRRVKEEKRTLLLHAKAARGDPKAITRELREHDD